ncbi:MAG TPA: 3-oxoacyl-[acyl-carrier-protein] synthase III C-terminal domain-containing protein [Pyrinomonadaceae bacterium]|jgi:3-oxoacyl-[acyl-carrier-protein] synthase III|nr:3-oxoacyl-[acyl-carrier-protein] synthase III C-terminal domain-containing protein [Pyrinomonadaceae bacterium]
MINLLSAATAVPKNVFKTTELVANVMHKLSPELINTISTLGVDQRYSILENYPDFLRGKPRMATSSTTQLSVDATKRCIQEWGGDPSRIGLLVAATNTPDQMLPCLASEIMGKTHGLLSRSLRTVSMQAQGCSVLLKSIEVAQWYLAANPGKLAIVVMSEAHTPYVAPLLRDEYFGYREIVRLKKEHRSNGEQFEQQRLDTTFVVQSMLFGDGAVALLVGTEEGKPAFGPISHLTNDQPNDMNLLTMVSNSSHPFLKGRPQYFMQPSVPTRGAHYAVTTVKNVLKHPDSPVSDIVDVDDCLIHTGSKKILDGVCSQLELKPDSHKVVSSYKVLEQYGNLSSASTGFMLAEKNDWSGPTMVVGFGVGFTASAGIMNFN